MFKPNGSMSAISLIEVADMRHDAKLIKGGQYTSQAVNVAMDNTLVVTR